MLAIKGIYPYNRYGLAGAWHLDHYVSCEHTQFGTVSYSIIQFKNNVASHVNRWCTACGGTKGHQSLSLTQPAYLLTSSLEILLFFVSIFHFNSPVPNHSSYFLCKSANASAVIGRFTQLSVNSTHISKREINEIEYDQKNVCLIYFVT